jgi:hypothetical protein
MRILERIDGLVETHVPKAGQVAPGWMAGEFLAVRGGVKKWWDE